MSVKVVRHSPVEAKVGTRALGRYLKDVYRATLECGHTQETHSTARGGPFRVDKCWTCSRLEPEQKGSPDAAQEP